MRGVAVRAGLRAVPVRCGSGFQWLVGRVTFECRSPSRFLTLAPAWSGASPCASAARKANAASGLPGAAPGSKTSRLPLPRLGASTWAVPAPRKTKNRPSLAEARTAGLPGRLPQNNRLTLRGPTFLTPRSTAWRQAVMGRRKRDRSQPRLHRSPQGSPSSKLLPAQRPRWRWQTWC